MNNDVLYFKTLEHVSSTRQNFFHNFLTPIHFSMNFWIKLNQFESIQIHSENGKK
jgi:hypothetical protein